MGQANVVGPTSIAGSFFSIVSACSYRQCFSSPVPTFIVDAVIITSKSISLLKLDM